MMYTNMKKGSIGVQRNEESDTTDDTACVTEDKN